jgi:hypothetical protein
MRKSKDRPESEVEMRKSKDRLVEFMNPASGEAPLSMTGSIESLPVRHFDGIPTVRNVQQNIVPIVRFPGHTEMVMTLRYLT